MNNLNFSVSMCVYGKDNPEWLTTAVDSILNQTYQPCEVILVVDGPVPNTLDVVIKKYEAMPLFKVVRLAVNQGHGNARRIGIENCTYDLIALMDADDISISDRFEKQIKMFEVHSELDIVGGNIAEFIESPVDIIGKRIVPENDEAIKVYLKKRCPMNQVTVMFRKQSIQAVGGYIDWYCNEDYYLWIRMVLADIKFANVSDILVNVRVGEDMYQRRGGWKYFKSEAKLQRYMLKNKVINFPIYLSNCLKRLILQVLMPNKLRGWVFKRFARKQISND